MAAGCLSSPHTVNWLGLPVVATVARLLCRELTLQNEYLRVENKVLRSKLPGRIRSTDVERCPTGRCRAVHPPQMGFRTLRDPPPEPRTSFLTLRHAKGPLKPPAERRRGAVGLLRAVRSGAQPVLTAQLVSDRPTQVSAQWTSRAGVHAR